MGGRGHNTDEHTTLWDQIKDLQNRVRRLELWMVAIAVATASPKLGGPDPSQLVGAVFHHLA